MRGATTSSVLTAAESLVNPPSPKGKAILDVRQTNKKPSPAEKVTSWSGANTMTDEEGDTLYGLSFLLIHRYRGPPSPSGKAKATFASNLLKALPFGEGGFAEQRRERLVCERRLSLGESSRNSG